jgi:endonuclease-3
VARLLCPAEIRRVFEALHRRWPDAHCELDHNNEYQLLLAVMLSAQTTDKAVNKALASLRARLPQFGPQEVLDLGEKGFLRVIRSIGLAPGKARYAVAMAQQLLERFGGAVPSGQADLESLPGVGRKTANVVRNVLFGVPTMPVDTHVNRVSQRLALVRPTKNLREIEETLLKKVPAKFSGSAHHLLIFLGRYVCAARSPKCTECPVESLCPRIGVDKTT